MKLHELSATTLADLMSKGETTSTEIVEALCARADETEGEVNALAHRFRTQALAAARESDEERRKGKLRGRLHGLPFTVKENVDVEGVASTLGMRARARMVARRDAVVVRAAKNAGAIVLGKGNVPQTLLSPIETTNFQWGTTKNPWDLGHAPGGSSGGEAAALASGASCLGIGTDIGGSIRLPAHFCGVSGLKPTANRWSNVGSCTAIAGQEFVRAQIGPLARSPRDVALLFTALSIEEQSRRDPAVPPLPAGDPGSVDITGLRVGYYDDDRFFTPAVPIRRAVREAVECLAKRGAEVVELAPDNAEEVTYLYFAGLSSDGTRTVKAALGDEEVIEPLKLLWRLSGLPRPARIAAAKALGMMGDHRVAGMLEVIGQKPVEDLWALTARRTALRLAELQAWARAGIDAMICPAHVTPAAPHGTSKDFTLSFCYAARYNLLDFPAGVTPVTRVRPDETTRNSVRDRLDRRAAGIEAQGEGLPIGVQVVAKPYREEVALAVMMAIEEGVGDSEGFPRTPVDPH